MSLSRVKSPCLALEITSTPEPCIGRVLCTLAAEQMVICSSSQAHTHVLEGDAL